MEFKDYYQTLGVKRDASETDLKKAFRKLAREFHPDVAKDKRAAEEKFKEINEAYEVLGNPESRRKYDELGANWRQGAAFRPPPGWQQRTRRTGGRPGAEDYEFHFGGTGFSDFFEQFFGRGGGGGGFSSSTRDVPEYEGTEGEEGAFAQRGADVEGSILVTLEEALRGSVRSVSVRSTNPRTGESETRTYRVRIPAGIQEGQTIRVAGKGEAGVGGARAGDLYLRVRLAAHPEFRVRGADLYHDLDLAPWEAVLGCTVAVPTLDGSVSVRIPPGTSGGQQLRVRHRGLPAGPSGERGDLYVVVTVQVPAQTTAEEKALWEQLARKSRFDPRKSP